MFIKLEPSQVTVGAALAVIFSGALPIIIGVRAPCLTCRTGGALFAGKRPSSERLQSLRTSQLAGPAVEEAAASSSDSLSHFSPQSSSPQTEGVKERPSLNPESTDPPENPGTSSGKSNGVPGAAIPTIIVSEYEPVPEQVEETGPEQEPRSAATCSEDKTEDSDNPLTHFKMIFKGLSRSRSQESLSKTTSEEETPQPDVSQRCGQNGAIRGETSEGSAWRHFNSRLNKKEKTTFKLPGGATKAKGREGGTLPRGEDSQCQKSQVNWEQMEATKAIFDLLKEISGGFSQETHNWSKNSVFFNTLPRRNHAQHH